MSLKIKSKIQKEEVQDDKDVIGATGSTQKRYDNWLRRLDIFDKILVIVARIVFAGFFIWLLRYQNLELLNFLSQTIEIDTNSIKDYQILLAVIIPATLAETYFIAKIMVRWVFVENAQIINKRKK